MVDFVVACCFRLIQGFLRTHGSLLLLALFLLPPIILWKCASPSLRGLKLYFHRCKCNACGMVRWACLRVIDGNTLSSLAWTAYCYPNRLCCRCGSRCSGDHVLDCCCPYILRLLGCESCSCRSCKICASGCCTVFGWSCPFVVIRIFSVCESIGAIH
jgi:hypothetical protein